jgi:toxin YoeB
MEVVYASAAKEDKDYWQKMDIKILHRIDKLIADIKLHPFTGLGKPEALRFEKSGYWSRRINHQHRLVYKVDNNIIYIAQCRYHYTQCG